MNWFVSSFNLVGNDMEYIFESVTSAVNANSCEYKGLLQMK